MKSFYKKMFANIIKKNIIMLFINKVRNCMIFNKIISQIYFKLTYFNEF